MDRLIITRFGGLAMVKETAKELAKLRKIFDPIVITPSKTLAIVYDIDTYLDVYPDEKLEKVFGMYELRKEMKRITVVCPIKCKTTNRLLDYERDGVIG